MGSRAQLTGRHLEGRPGIVGQRLRGGRRQFVGCRRERVGAALHLDVRNPGEKGAQFRRAITLRQLPGEFLQ